jgi:plastocyanin
MRVLTTRFALAVLAVGSVCALADTAQAQRRLFGRRAAVAAAAYDPCCYGGMYGGAVATAAPSYMGPVATTGYAQPAYVPSPTTYGQVEPCALPAPGAYGVSQGQVIYGGARPRLGLGARLFPGRYATTQPMISGGAVYQAGYTPALGHEQHGTIPAGGIVPGQLPTRPIDGSAVETNPGEAKPVKITDNAFSPADLEVKVGTTVKWTNDGKKPHTVSSDKGDWGSGELASGQTFTATFTKAGTFEYHCRLHPDMKARITVK